MLEFIKNLFVALQPSHPPLLEKHWFVTPETHAAEYLFYTSLWLSVLFCMFFFPPSSSPHSPLPLPSAPHPLLTLLHLLHLFLDKSWFVTPETHALEYLLQISLWFDMYSSLYPLTSSLILLATLHSFWFTTPESFGRL